jgi:hypothetical protein
MTSSSTTAGPRGVPRGWLLATGLIALSYGGTSLVVVVNALGNATGVVWLPSFPAGYYRFSQWLSWPFQWYFTLLAPLQAHPRVSYMMYALIGYAPFLIGSVTVLVVAILKGYRANGTS